MSKRELVGEAANLIPGVGQAKAAKKVGNFLLGGTKRRIVAGATIFGLLLGAFGHSQDTQPVTKIVNAGKGAIQTLTLTPGLYCNAEAVVAVKDVKTQFTHFDGASLLGVSVGIHAWTSEAMSGNIEAKVCVETDALKTVTKSKDGPTYDLTLTASSVTSKKSKDKSDFTLIEYPQDPTKMKYTEDNSNIQKLQDMTVGTIENDIDEIPGAHLNSKSSIQDRLKALDLLEGYNYVSLACGPKIVGALTKTHIPGGNMQTKMITDMIDSTPGAKGVVKPSEIHITVDIDKAHPGIPNQYSTPDAADGKNATSLFEQIEQQSAEAVKNKKDAFTFPTKGLAACQDLVKAVGHATS